MKSSARPARAGTGTASRSSGRIRPALAAIRQAMALLVLCWLLGPLGGCAGGEPGVGSSGTGLGTSGTQVGAIDGFGSIVVGGTAYDESAVEVLLDVDPTVPTPSSVAALQFGMQVELDFVDDTVARRLRVVPTVIGPVSTLESGVGEDELVVNGQRVRLRRDGPLAPVFEGFEALSDLAPGDWLVVHGARDESDRIDATRVERRIAEPAEPYRVVGDVTSADSSGFRIEGLQVLADAGTQWIPAAPVGGLAPGLRVHVTGTPAGVGGVGLPGTSTVTASVIRIVAMDQARRIRVDGRIRRPAGSRIRVDDLTVETAGARIEGGTAADLGVGTRVRVDGRVVDGILAAERVQIVAAGMDSVTVVGLVSDFVSPESFRIRRVLVDAQSAAPAFTNGTAADFADGVLVEAGGTVRDGRLRATRIRFVRAADPRTLAVAGTVQAVLADGRYTVDGVTVRPTATSLHRFGDGSPATPADVVAGVRIVAGGAYGAADFVADRITVLLRDAPRLVSTEGYAYRVDPVERTLRIGGWRVAWSLGTQIVGDPARLQAGARVEAAGVVVDGILQAARLTLID